MRGKDYQSLDPSVEEKPAKNGKPTRSVRFKNNHDSSGKNEEAAASRNQKIGYYALSGIIWASLGPEVLYMFFSQIAGKEGLEKIIHTLLHREITDNAAESNTWVLAAMDLVINFLLVDPNNDGASVLGLEKNDRKKLVKKLKKNKQELQESINDHQTRNSCSQKIFTRLIPFLAMAFQFPIGGLADFIPIDKKGWITNEGSKIAVCVGLVVLGIAYYSALSARDVFNSADNYVLRLKESELATVYRQSKLAFIDGSLTAMATHLFRAFVFGYIPYKAFENVLGEDARMAAVAIGFTSGFIVSGLTRTKEVFDALVKESVTHTSPAYGSIPSLASKKVDEFYFEILAKNLPWHTKIKSYIPGLLIGLARGIPAAELAYHYAGVKLSNKTDWSIESITAMQAFLGGFTGAAFLIPAICVHHESAQRKAVEATYRPRDETCTDQRVTGICSPHNVKSTLALVLNAASQILRALISIEATSTILIKLGMEPEQAVIFAIFIVLQVAYANGLYFQGKAEQGVQRLFSGCASAFGWLADDKGRNPKPAKDNLDKLEEVLGSDTTPQPEEKSGRDEDQNRSFKV